MAIPEFEAGGQLPPGDWEAGWDEIEQRFAYNFRRREILAGLRHVVELLVQHGVTEIWLDGSFVTDRIRPNDVDVVYAISPGEDDADWDDVGPARRRYVKDLHRVDLWRYPSWQRKKGDRFKFGPITPNNRITIKQYFESDRDETPCGLVQLVLGREDDQEPQAIAGGEEQNPGS